MGHEIERKFLVRGDEWRQATPARYRQGYLSRALECTVRIRTIQRGAEAEAFLTIKGITTGAHRAEFEYPIPIDDAQEMLASLCDGPLVEKDRRKIEYAGLVWEVDEFFGDNAGLVCAEVELQREEQAIELPPWMGREVTDLARYFNASLSSYPYRQWRDDEKLTP